MGFKVTFNNASAPMTIKSTGSATSIGKLTDIDTSTPDGDESGATLVYDATTKTYKAEKVFEFDGDEVTMKGGSF